MIMDIILSVLVEYRHPKDSNSSLFTKGFYTKTASKFLIYSKWSKNVYCNV